MSRVLVAAPYPTMPGPEAAATLALVRALVAAGDEVTVASPAPSAAHHHADPGGARGAYRLLRLAARADRLVLRLDAEALAASASPPRALAGRLGLAATMRRVPHVEVHLDRVPATVSPRWAWMVLGAAGRVVVDSDEARTALMIAGVPGDRVDVERRAEPAAAPAAPPTPAPASAPAFAAVPAGATAADLQRLVRGRAAEQRAARRRPATPTRGPGGEVTAVPGEASGPLRRLAPMGRAPVASAKPAGALVKRSLAKVLAWQFDWVIEHVNRLHQATIESVEALETGQSGDET